MQHSEFNYSETGTTHFLQIWIIPARDGVAPSYAQQHFSVEEKRGRLRLVVSPDGADGSVGIHQDARMYAGLFDGDERAQLAIAPGRLAYVHVARGSATVNGHALVAGDALLYADETAVEIGQGQGAEVLVFDLPPVSYTHLDVYKRQVHDGAARVPQQSGYRWRTPANPTARRVSRRAA